MFRMLIFALAFAVSTTFGGSYLDGPSFIDDAPAYLSTYAPSAFDVISIETSFVVVVAPVPPANEVVPAPPAFVRHVSQGPGIGQWRKA